MKSAIANSFIIVKIIMIVILNYNETNIKLTWKITNSFTNLNVYNGRQNNNNAQSELKLKIILLTNMFHDYTLTIRETSGD